jgi:hypothetical protein
MYSVMAIFRSSIVWGLFEYSEFFIASQRKKIRCTETFWSPCIIFACRSSYSSNPTERAVPVRCLFWFVLLSHVMHLHRMAMSLITLHWQLGHLNELISFVSRRDVTRYGALNNYQSFQGTRHILPQIFRNSGIYCFRLQNVILSKIGTTKHIAVKPQTMLFLKIILKEQRFGTKWWK